MKIEKRVLLKYISLVDTAALNGNQEWKLGFWDEAVCPSIIRKTFIVDISIEL